MYILYQFQVESISQVTFNNYKINVLIKWSLVVGFLWVLRDMCGIACRVVGTPYKEGDDL